MEKNMQLIISHGHEAPDYSHIQRDKLWSEILPGLWQGGTDDLDVIGNPTHAVLFAEEDCAFITPHNFDTVITLYQYANPVGWFVKEYRYCVYDWRMSHINLKELYKTAKYAHAEWKDGNRVLIRCQAGLNRSSLVMALVLIIDGHTPTEAINLIRQKRNPECLFNKEFEQFLLNLDENTIKHLTQLG
jgi:hypothetical protein